MISRRVSSPMFEYWNAFIIIYVLSVFTSVSIYRAVKTKSRYWIITSLILLIAVALFILANLFIQNSAIIPSSYDERWISM